MKYFLTLISFVSLSAQSVEKSVTNMRGVFYDSFAFNQDISNWNVSNVTTMRDMFHNSPVFNQDLSSWNVINVSDFSNFNYNTPQWTLPKPIF